MGNLLILASKSSARQRLLESARVPFQTISSGVSEAPIKAECQAKKLSPMETAMFLARAKADDVSRDYPDALVLAADQILSCGGTRLDKPKGHDGLESHLRRLEGRAHELVNAAVIVQSGKVVWQYQDSITMVMRQLSDAFIETYIREVGETACQSVGGYQIEGMGVQLFDCIDGDFFSILGLPLLPLLGFLRSRKVVVS